VTVPVVGLIGARAGQRAGCCVEGNEKLQFLRQPTNCRVKCGWLLYSLWAAGVVWSNRRTDKISRANRHIHSVASWKQNTVHL